MSTPIETNTGVRVCVVRVWHVVWCERCGACAVSLTVCCVSRAWGCVACVQCVVTCMVLRVLCAVVCYSVALFRHILEGLINGLRGEFLPSTGSVR